MSDEENIVETIENKKMSNYIWKILLIITVSIGVIIASGIGTYNSDWFITKTMPIKEKKNVKLGNRITYSYINKYEDGKLKVNFKLENIDERIYDIAGRFFDKKDDLVTLEFIDKDGFKITELKLPMEEFHGITGTKGEYNIQSYLVINKNDIRKIKEISPSYRAFIDMTYEEMIKKVKQQVKEYYNNYF